MKRYILLYMIATATANIALAAQVPTDGICVDSLSMERNGDYVAIRMNLGLQDVKIDANRTLLITPCISGEDDEYQLPAVGIYSRTRYYHYLRTNGNDMLSGRKRQPYGLTNSPRHYPTKHWFPTSPGWKEHN